MRGKEGLKVAPHVNLRITPAYAGKRNHLPYKPRMCKGSPPRMRGKDDDLVLMMADLRITPAYAGKRRGLLAPAFWLLGSPPRMRGKAMASNAPRRGAGITPAYAGKSWLVAVDGIQKKDHPRVCGEKCYVWVKSVTLQGSPPRMRGKGAGTGHPCMAAGITPAYAGKRTE